MGTKYFKQAGGNWNDANNWSAISSLDVDNAGVPTAADDVIFDANSGNLTINGTPVARSINCTGYTGTWSGTTLITLGDGTAGASNIILKLVAGMTIGAVPFTFVTTSGTLQDVDFAGKTTGNVDHTGAGANLRYVGNHTIGTTGTMTVTRGTVNFNGQTYSWGLFNTNNTNTRSITFGAADVTITGGSTTVWNITQVTGLTLSAASATFKFTGNSFTVTPGNLTYGVFEMTLLSSSNTLNNSPLLTTLTIISTAIKTNTLMLGGNPTISGTFTPAGNSIINRLIIRSTANGTPRTITAGTWAAAHLDLRDVVKGGVGVLDLSAITGGSGDCGGNSNITFTTAAPQVCTMGTNKNWSDVTIWTSRVPLPQDDVSLASVTGGTLTADMPRLGKSIDWTGATGSPTWAFSSTTNDIFGSLTEIAGMTVSGTQALTFRGRGAFSITSAGKQFTQAVTFDAPTGMYTLQDNFSTAGVWTLSGGGFDANDFDVTALTFVGTGTVARILDMGNGDWNITSTATATIWNFATITNLTFDGDQATINIVNTSANIRTFSGGGIQDYGILNYTNAGSVGELHFVGNNSFADVNISDASNARTIKFTDGSTTTIRNTDGFDDVRGSSGKLITLDSISGGSFNLVHTTGYVDTDYLSIKNSNASGGSGWFAGTHSTDVSGNTGWTFTEPVLVTGSAIFGDEGGLV